jgi:hypothetical protein
MSIEAMKQEPVAFRNINTGEFCTGGFLRKDWAKWQPLYPAPVHAIDILQERVDEMEKSKHEWVGLTDDDIWEVFKEHDSMQYMTFSRAIEAKLKEKNYDRRD